MNRNQATTAIVAFLLAAVANAQQIETDHGATRACRLFLGSLSKAWPGAGAEASRDKVAGTSYDQWNVQARDGAWTVSLDAATGRVTGYHDLELDARARSLTEQMTEPRISAETASHAARAFLEAALGPGHGFTLASTVLQPASPGYDVPFYEIRFSQSAPEPWEGAVNRYKVTVDGLEGRVLMAGGTVRLRFSPPNRVLDAASAVSALRSVFEEERDAARLRGDATAEKAWQWPGNETVARTMRLGALADGARTAGSIAGREMTDAGTVRVAYTLTMDGVTVAVDAESGEPLLAQRIKAESVTPSAHGTPAERRQPSQPIGSWITVAAIAAVLAGSAGWLAVIKLRSKR
ncbi:MAG: hypothetical protein AB7F50_11310 [Fimbriimonadaceae bacterium]